MRWCLVGGRGLSVAGLSGGSAVRTTDHPLVFGTALVFVHQVLELYPLDLRKWLTLHGARPGGLVLEMSQHFQVQLVKREIAIHANLQLPVTCSQRLLQGRMLALDLAKIADGLLELRDQLLLPVLRLRQLFVRGRPLRNALLQ